MKRGHSNLEWQSNMRLAVSNMTISKRGATPLALYIDIVYFVVKGGGNIHIHHRSTKRYDSLTKIERDACREYMKSSQFASLYRSDAYATLAFSRSTKVPQPVAPHRLAGLMYKYSYIVPATTIPDEDPVQSTWVELLQDAVERDNPPIRAAKRRAIERISIADDADFFYGTGEGGDSISIASGDIADPTESVPVLVQSSVRDFIDLTGTSTNTDSYEQQYEYDFAPEEVSSTFDSTSAGSNCQKSLVRNEYEYENTPEVAHNQEHSNNANASPHTVPARLIIVHPGHDSDDESCHGVGFGQQFPSCTDLTALPDVIEQLCQVSLDPCSDDFSFVPSITPVDELQDVQLFGPDFFKCLDI